MVISILGISVSAHAKWKTLETWYVDGPTSVDKKTHKTATSWTSERITTQYTDDAGNTVEKIEDKMYRWRTTPVHTTSLKYMYVKQQRCRWGRCGRIRSLRWGKPISTVEVTEEKTGGYQRTDLISETIVAYAEVEEVVEEVAEVVEETPVVEEVVEEEVVEVVEEVTEVVEEEEVVEEVVEETVVETPVETASNVNSSSMDFGVNTQYLGTKTSMASSLNTYYKALGEFDNNKFNGVVNQDQALARGWTGKGSTILILDSGIDVDHAEFEGKIKYTYTWDNQWGTGINDNVGHGTHVAGIAAGKMDGNGIMGIAPDADLAIVKTTDNWSGGTYWARKGIAHMKQYEDIVVANVSANTNYQNSYKNSVSDQGNGIFTSNHEHYGGANYYNQADPTLWGDAMSDSEIVLTISAGNSSLGYVQNPATFASATDSSGNLLLGGRMIVVGNWNPSTNTVDGAKSGHVCKDYSNNTCNDKYTTNQFYILAPGSNIESSYNDGGYKNMSGTSQAAPVVAGAVAVVHQMWPYMPGADIAQLLLKTADKTITGYDESTHGQGLLDLNTATMPQGDLGISFSGRTGSTSALSGSISMSSDNSSLSSVLSTVSVVDEIGRDYTVNLSSMSNTGVSIVPIWHMNHQAGDAWSAKYAGGDTSHNGVSFGSYDNDHITMSFDSTINAEKNADGSFKEAQNVIHKLTYSSSMYSPYVAFDGMFGTVHNTTTLEYSSVYKPNNWYAQGGIMYSMTDIDQGMVTEVTPITSLYAVGGYTTNGLNLYGGIKPTIVDGTVQLTLPTSVDSTGTMHYTDYEADLRTGPVTFIGFNFGKNVLDNHTVSFNSVIDQTGTKEVGASYSINW